MKIGPEQKLVRVPVWVAAGADLVGAAHNYFWPRFFHQPRLFVHLPPGALRQGIRNSRVGPIAALTSGEIARFVVVPHTYKVFLVTGARRSSIGRNSGLQKHAWAVLCSLGSCALHFGQVSCFLLAEVFAR